MKVRSAFVLLCVSLALFYGAGVGRGTVYASNTSCSGSLPCVAQTTWVNSNNHGIAAEVTIDNPGTTSGYYMKIMEVDQFYNSAGPGFEEVGITKGSNPYVSCSNSTLQYFYDWDTASAPVCKALDSNDINQQTEFRLSYYASNGGGGFVYIYNTGSGHNPCPFSSPCSFSDSHLSNNFTESLYNINYKSASFSGHAVWGGDWSVNEYFKTAWNYDATTPDHTLIESGTSINESITSCSSSSVPGAPPPPAQGCWFDTPNGTTNLGGDYYTCIYDSNVDNCTLGS